MLSSDMPSPAKPDMRKLKIKGGLATKNARATRHRGNMVAIAPRVMNGHQGRKKGTETARKLCEKLAQSTPSRVAPLIILGTSATSCKNTDAESRKAF